jgi:hypothetical protein
MFGNAFLGTDMHLNNNTNFSPGAGNQMAVQSVGSSFQADLHYGEGYFEHQTISNAVPFQTTPSMHASALLSYPQQFVSPPPAQVMTEQPEVTFEGFTLDLVGLSIQDDCDADELARRRSAITKNQEFHKQHPPVIPDHTLGEMAPKEVFPDFIRPTLSTTDEEKVVIERENNCLAAQLQKEDRARNNEAAKRSRLAKTEALTNATKLNISQSIRIAWLEAKVISLGGNPSQFDSISPEIYERIRGEVISRMDLVYERRKKERGETESRRRTIRNKDRQRKKIAANERFARQRAAAVAAAAASSSSSSSDTPEAAPDNGMMYQRDWASLSPSNDFTQN